MPDTLQAPPGRTDTTGPFRRTVAVFTIATWLGAGALLALQPVVRLDPELLTLPQFGPSIGVLAVLALRKRPCRISVSLRPTRAVLIRCAAGAGLVAAVLALCLGALVAAGRPVHLTGPGSLAGPFWLLAVLQWVGACGEELGWRAFLQRHLETRFATPVSAVAVGVLWGTWHVQYYRFGLAFVAAFLVMTVAISLLMSVLVKGAGAGALLVAGTFHWLLNLGILLLLDFEQGDLVTMAALAACSAVVAASVQGFARRRRSVR
ncbi:CPBP family intramembrane glutamic endopeptidase [Kitasatospora sp. NPDC056138]|uniref:CPBP family intramembrane glutamic endopeptidase n=1 Tax=Kitasatospora sp. NPDC056138 TaxID=3345724 RepID=UPI0035DEF9C1